MSAVVGTLNCKAVGATTLTMQMVLIELLPCTERVIVAVPVAIKLTRPVESTVATLVSLDSQTYWGSLATVGL